MENNKHIIELSKLSQEDFRRWQLKLLEILVYFRDFCVEHNLKFCVAAGTCLGAVRHKGFIPWDDDVDVIMPRDDYDKLFDLWEKYADKNKFLCCKTTEKQSIGFPMMVIRNVNTTCIYEHSKDWDICQGLKIDVEHFDAVPKGNLSKFYQKTCAKALALFRAQRVPNGKSNFVKLTSKLILTVFSSPRINYKISSFLEYQIKRFDMNNAEYVSYLAGRPIKKDLFDNLIWVDFENSTMPIPQNYHEYLSIQYGNYMQLPPIDKRKPITKCLFYDLDNSYLKYKGIYYCTKNSK